MLNLRGFFLSKWALLHRFFVDVTDRAVVLGRLTLLMVCALTGSAMAAGEQSVAVTEYKAEPARSMAIGEGGKLQATIKASSAVAPAYAVLVVPPHYQAGALPAGCEVQSYEALQTAQKPVPSEALVLAQENLGYSSVKSIQMLWCQRASMASGEAWKLELPVIAKAMGYHESAAFATSGLTPSDTSWTVQKSENWLEVVAAVDLALSKTAPTTVKSGDALTYTLTIKNQGGADAPAVQLIDYLPPANELEYQGVSGASCTLSGRELTCEVGAVAAGGSKAVLITGRVVQQSGTQTNNAEVKLGSGSSGVVEVETTNNSAHAKVDVVKAMHLKANKAMKPTGKSSKMTAGEGVKMTLSATNAGVVSATGVKVRDMVPAHFLNVQPLNSECRIVQPYSEVNGTEVECSVAELAKGVTSVEFEFTMQVKPFDASELTGTNTATVIADRPNDVIEANFVLESKSVDYRALPAVPQLTLAKSKKALKADGSLQEDGIPAKWGDYMLSTIVVGNTGKDAISTLELDPNGPYLEVTETLGPNEAWVKYEAAQSGWRCDAQAGDSNKTVTCQYVPAKKVELKVGATLPPLEITTQAQSVDSAASAVVTNSACVPQKGIDGEKICGTGEVKVVPVSVSLKLEKLGELKKGANTPVDDELVYTLLVKNEDGPDTAKSVKVVDSLPMWFQAKEDATVHSQVSAKGSVNNQVPLNFTCTNQGGEVTCVIPSLEKGAQAEIEVRVGRPFKIDAGSMTNTFRVSSEDTQILNQNEPSNPASPSEVPKELVDLAVTNVFSTTTPLRVGVEAVFQSNYVNYGATPASKVVLRQVIDTEKFDIKSASVTSTSSSDSCTTKTFGGTGDANFDGKTGVECVQDSLPADAAWQLRVTVVPKFSYFGDRPLDQACTSTRMMRMAASVDRDQCAVVELPTKIWTSTTQTTKENDAQTGHVSLGREQVDLKLEIRDVYADKVYDPAALNSTVPYQVTISNKAGGSIATGVSFYLKGKAPAAPAGFSMTAEQAQLNASGVQCLPYVDASASWDWTCTLPTALASGESRSFILPFKLAATESAEQEFSGYKQYELFGMVFSNETKVAKESTGGAAADAEVQSDLFPADNKTSQKTSVTAMADVSVTKTASVGVNVVDVRQPFTYQLVVENAGPSAAAGVVVTDQLDRNLDWPQSKDVAIDGDGKGVCTVSDTGLLRCVIERLAKDKKVTLTVPVRVTLGYTGTAIHNTANVQSSSSGNTTEDGTDIPTFIDPDPGNNNVTPPVVVDVKPVSVSGKVVVAPAGTDISQSDIDTSLWTGVPNKDVLVVITGKDKWGNDVRIDAPKKNNDGTFVFEGLPPSNGDGYTVTQTQPVGYLDYKDRAPVGNGTTPQGYVQSGETEAITGIQVAEGQDVVGLVFAEVQASKISGFVFQDLDSNQLHGSDDRLLNGYTVKLTGTDYTGATVTEKTVQTAAGVYEFDGLAPGSYQVSITKGEALEYIGTSIDQVLGSTANTLDVTLGSADQKTKHNFGFKATGEATGATNTISGRVYIDGVPGQPGIGGVEIKLSGTTSDGSDICVALSPSPCSIKTDAQGNYSFKDLPNSNGTGYSVTQVKTGAADDPLGLYADATEQQNGNPVESSVVVGNDVFSHIVLNGNSSHGSLDFAEKLFSIAGSVEAVSRLADEQRTALPEVLVKISGKTATGQELCPAPAGSLYVCEMRTDAQGAFHFEHLPAGTYTLTEMQPAGYANHANVVGTAGGQGQDGVEGSSKVSQFTEIAFQGQTSETPTPAEKLNASGYIFQEKGNALTGWVYIDSNNDGNRQTTEPGIGGVKVTLTDGAGKSYEATTNPDGSFAFTGLPDGTYTLVETQPAGFLDGAVTAGGTGGATVGTACTTNNCNTITNIVLEGGKTYDNYLFAETGATLSGIVYEEQIDPVTGESRMGPGLGGVSVKLVPKSAEPGWCKARADKCKATTDQNGHYAFEGVPPGTYDVVKDQNQLSEFYAAQGKAYTDGMETAGKAGGTVENRYFGTQAGYNTIANIEVTPEQIAANNGLLDGYLFGVRLGNGNTPGLVPPIINGYVYMDRTHDRVRDPLVVDGEAGWTVTLRTEKGDEICTVHTDGKGFYQFDNLHCSKYPNGLPTSDSLGSKFEISFSKDGTVLPNMTSSGDGVGTPGSAVITDLVVKDADEIVEQNLPLDPAGVIYDAVTRVPVAGAVISIEGPPGFNPVDHLLGGSEAQTQTTGVDGKYNFVLLSPSGNFFPSGIYTLKIDGVPAAYLPGASVMIPACVNTLDVTYLGPNFPALIQAQDGAPGQAQAMHEPGTCPVTTAGNFNDAKNPSAAQQTTQYYMSFVIRNSNGSSEILNNHIPLDPVLAGGAIVVTKTTPKVHVSKSDLVPYTITATNRSGGALENVRVRDLLPPGFRYRKGSATWNGLPVEPEVQGRELTWPSQNFATNEKKTYQLLLMVGAGVGDGEYVNQAWALNTVVNERISNVAQAVVRVVPDPTFDCSDLIGKVFDDKNANGYQDQGEPGIPNVRLVTARGLLVTTDADGRFHVACAAIPQADRGSNFVMKLDERTLPSGYRMTSENPRDVRVTRGKMVKLNFGATVHKVVRVEVDSRAFNAESQQLTEQWDTQLVQLLPQLAERPTVLRIAYRMTGEEKDVAEQRLQALRERIQLGYQQQAQQRQNNKAEDETPPLVIETESFEQSQGQGVR